MSALDVRHTHAYLVTRIESQWAEQTMRVNMTGTVPARLLSPVPKPIPLTKTEKTGLWVWLLLLGPAVVYELIAFADGREGNATLSQVVKGLRRAGGFAAAAGLALALLGAFVALLLHWVWEVF